MLISSASNEQVDVDLERVHGTGSMYYALPFFVPILHAVAHRPTLLYFRTLPRRLAYLS